MVHDIQIRNTEWDEIEYLFASLVLLSYCSIFIKYMLGGFTCVQCIGGIKHVQIDDHRGYRIC